MTEKGCDFINLPDVHYKWHMTTNYFIRYFIFIIDLWTGCERFLKYCQELGNLMNINDYCYTIFLVIRQAFLFQNNPKDLDLSLSAIKWGLNLPKQSQRSRSLKT